MSAADVTTRAILRTVIVVVSVVLSMVSRDSEPNREQPVTAVHGTLEDAAVLRL